MYKSLIKLHSYVPKRRFVASFSTLSDAFNLSQTSSNWPQPLRTCSCNALTTKNLNEKVNLSGWVDSVRIMKDSVFIVLRDGEGMVQTMFACDKDVESILKQIPLESVVCIQGTVQKRPDDAINPKMATGEIEIKGDKCYLLNPSTSLPFPYHGKLPKDEVLSKYRHLALRHPEYLNELKYRSNFLFSLRTNMNHLGFTEVETPLLTRSSPEGAHELYVPTALVPHGGYALSQSPQQYKQILMSSGIDKYYQIARCFRNECGRKDRQLEFTQLDLEMAYEIKHVIETVLSSTIQTISPSSQLQFESKSYDDCLQNYGSDKPDLRIPLKLVSLPNSMYSSTVHKVITLHFKNIASIVSNSKLKQILHSMEGSCAKRTRLIRCEYQNGEMKYASSADKLVNMNKILQYSKEHEEFTNGDLLVIGVEMNTDSKQYTNQYEFETIMGRLRTMLYNLGQDMKLLPAFDKLTSALTPIHFLWVEHFPLFEYDTNGQLKATHHPFTSPMTISTVDEMKQCSNVLSLKSNSCDLVLNGNEVGGGSLRIHNHDLQYYIMKDILGIANTDVFNHLLNALKHGCPPHGGFAVGLDRLLCLLRDKQSIRDVIAFSKSITGADPLTSAPTLIRDDQWKEVGMLYFCLFKTKIIIKTLLNKNIITHHLSF